MDGNSDKSQDITKPLADTVSKSNKCIPRGLLLRELGFKQKEKKVSAEFQHAAEDKLVLKNHEELHCELPDVSRSTFLMVFSPDGTKVASTHGNHNVYVTDLNTGKNVNTLSGHPRTPWCIAFHPSSNQILASGCLGGQVRVWDLHGGSEIWTAESETVIASLAFHPTDRMLVIATYNELHFWDWSQPVPFTKCYTTNEKEKVRYVAFDPLGHKLITGISNAPHNQSQWDRVANTTPHQGATNPLPSITSQSQSNMMLPEHERRIATCYQSLVEQYERLVQRYYDLSRSRTAVTMDRGTDPMEMAESPSAIPAPSGTNTQSSGLMGRLLMRGNGEGSSSGGTSNVGNEENTNRSEDGGARDDAASTRGTGRGRFFRNISSIVLGHMIRRVQRQRATSNSRSSQIERVDQFPGSNIGTDTQGEPANEPQAVTNNVPLANTPSNQAPLGQLSFSPIACGDSSEVTPEESRPAASSTPVSESSGLPADGTREQPMRLGSIEIISESGEVERHGLFSRLHSQVQPSTPSPPERPRRFFVSQRSAFQPRVPRGDQQPPSDYHQPRLLGTPRCSRFLLQRRLGGHSQRSHDSHTDSSLRDSMSSASLDGSSEVGVRYGIQLLSRHIDNMQRLCRARLEILQLQQIRRMWEDLQRQIQSLHVAVIEGNFASSETPNVPTGRSRRGRFRLYSHPGDISNSRMRSDARHYARRTADTSSGATEQGSHIPSVSQMLESARISDSSQPSSNERDTGSSGSSESAAGNDQSSSHAGLNESGKAKPKSKYTEREKQQPQRDTEAEGDTENTASSSRKYNTAKDAPVSSAAKLTFEAIDLNTPGPSNQKSANELSDQSTAAQKTEVDNMVPHKKPKVDDNKPKVAENSTSSAESSSDNNNKSSAVSNKVYGTTVSANDRGSGSNTNNTSQAHHSGNSSGESSENFTASAQASPPSTHFPHRLWRISRRVYLRRPRLLALGPRARTMARHVTGTNLPPHRGYSLFRPFDFGRRPWFLQSVASQSSQLDQSNNAALQDDASNSSQRSNDEDSSSSRFNDGQAPSVRVERNTSAGTSSQRAPAEQRQQKGAARASQESTSQPGTSRGREADAGSNPATRGTKRKHDGSAKQTGSAPSQPSESSSQRTSQETSTSSSLRAMISRLSALVQQQREQQEIAHADLPPSRRGNRRTNMWGLREPPGWLRSDGNSGSDSDSNPDNEHQRSWRRASMEERDTAERDVSSRWSSPCQVIQGEMDSEWVRESTRMRARQVLSMMVESLTQFFEANGLSNSTSHAVLDEQIYSLYVLLQLALELTDLLLAQLVTTRQQLEQQWVHRLHNPVALNSSSTPEDSPTGGHGPGRRVRRLTRQDYDREFRRLDQIIGRTDNGCRVTPYRNRLFRHSRGLDEDVMSRLDYLPGSSSSSGDQSSSGANLNRDESSRRLGPRVSFYQRDEAYPMYARYPVLTRVVRGTNCRPLMRTVLSRAESRLRLPGYSRDSMRTPPYVRSSLFPRGEERQSHSPPPDPAGGSPRPVPSPSGSGGAAAEQGQQNEQQTTQQQSSGSPQQQDSFTVPLVRVNDVLIPDTSLLNQPSPRQRPQSPPPHPLPNIRNPFIQQQQQQGSTAMYSGGSSIGDPWRYPGSPGYPGDSSWRSGWRPRFLHPRYVGPNPFNDDQEESLIGHPMETINVIRDSFIITDAPMSPNHRIQAWDFSKFVIPDISNAEKNIIVAECKIHNDASVDVSSDGRLLVTLLPTGRLSSSTAMLGIYSLEWESLGQCLYTTSFEQNAVSVSLSPANRHLLVGLASRRVALLPSDRQTLAQVFRMEGGHPGRAVGARGRLCHIRDIEQSREQGYMSINCIRWAPGPGQGLVYGTNTGKLRVLR